jgi:thioredoxin 1
VDEFQSTTLPPFLQSKKNQSMVHIQTFNDQDFGDQVLKSDKPVLIMFTAQWSGPSKSAISDLQRFADENVGLVKVGKVDIDESPLTASSYNVRTAPHCIFFKNGHKISERTGYISLQSLLTLVS